MIKFKQNKIKASSFKISYDTLGSFRIELFEYDSNKGSNFYLYENNERVIFINTSYELKPDFLNNHTSDFYKFIDNTFISFCFDKQTKKLLIYTDYFGLQTVYYHKTHSEIVISPLINHFESKENLNVNNENLKEHFALGYVRNQESIFYDFPIFKKRKIYTIDTSLNISYSNYLSKIQYNSNSNSKNKVNFSNLKTALNDDLRNSKNINIGITAGKDSQALLSIVMGEDKNVNVSNFGFKDCDDVFTGHQISKDLNLNYNHINLCNEKEFNYYSSLISYFSSGLATSSYVDMLKYVDTNFKENEAFVMGEGGECVRIFYDDNDKFSHFITPKYLLDNVFEDINYEHYKDIFKTNKDFINEFGVEYYREERLTGNFSKRNSILSPYVNKLTPFLNKNFINCSFGLNSFTYKKNLIHNYLVSNNKKIKHYYEQNSYKNDSQIWHQRIDLITKKFVSIHNSYDYNELGIKKTGVIKCLKSMRSNKRAIYFILRLLTLIEFINSYRLKSFQTLEKNIFTFKN